MVSNQISVIQQQLASLQQAHTDKINQRLAIPRLMVLTEKLAQKDAEGKLTEEVKQALSATVDSLPKASPIEKHQMKAFDKAFSRLKLAVKKQYDFVTTGYFLAVFMSIGVALGFTFGSLFLGESALLGMPFGILVGVGIGSFLDSKAKKEGRVF